MLLQESSFNQLAIEAGIRRKRKILVYNRNSPTLSVSKKISSVKFQASFFWGEECKNNIIYSDCQEVAGKLDNREDHAGENPREGQYQDDDEAVTFKRTI